MEILKVRIEKLKNGNALHMVVDKSGAAADVVNADEKHKALMHNDLYNAIQALAPHLAIMNFYVSELDVEDIAMPDKAKFDPFTVGSYVINGKDEKAGIQISGTLRKNGRAANFTTPFYRFEEAESTRYTFMDDLVARLKHIEAEVMHYLNGSKRGEPVQAALDLPEEEKVTKIQIDNPNEKVTAEGNAVSEKDKHKYANRDAMQRVAEMDADKGKGKKTTKKKVQQSAAAPSGEIEEAVE